MSDGTRTRDSQSHSLESPESISRPDNDLRSQDSSGYRPGYCDGPHADASPGTGAGDAAEWERLASAWAKAPAALRAAVLALAEGQLPAHVRLAVLALVASAVGRGRGND